MNTRVGLVAMALPLAIVMSLADADEVSESIDEITVLGVLELGALRAELTRAEDEVYELYNDLNDNDDYDIICERRAPVGSQIKQRVCLARLYRDSLADTLTDDDFPVISRRSLANSEEHNQALRENMRALASEHPELIAALKKRYGLQQKFEVEREKRFSKDDLEKE